MVGWIPCLNATAMAVAVPQDGGHYYDYYEYYQYYYDYSLLQTDLDDNRQGACKCGRCSISEASLFE